MDERRQPSALVDEAYAALGEAIVDGRGRVTIDSTIWEVSGPDAPKGARVTVTGVDGLKLTVEPVAG